MAYPNHWPDTSTFIEGGCYLVDNSAAGLGSAPVVIPVETPSSVAAGNNLTWTGTYPSAPSWSCVVTYTIDVGAAPGIAIAYDIDGDMVDPTNFQQLG